VFNRLWEPTINEPRVLHVEFDPVTTTTLFELPAPPPKSAVPPLTSAPSEIVIVLFKAAKPMRNAPPYCQVELAPVTRTELLLQDAPLRLTQAVPEFVTPAPPLMTKLTKPFQPMSNSVLAPPLMAKRVFEPLTFIVSVPPVCCASCVWNPAP